MSLLSIYWKSVCCVRYYWYLYRKLVFCRCNSSIVITKTVHKIYISILWVVNNAVVTTLSWEYRLQVNAAWAPTYKHMEIRTKSSKRCTSEIVANLTIVCLHFLPQIIPSSALILSQHPSYPAGISQGKCCNSILNEAKTGSFQTLLTLSFTIILPYAM
jgi:hypothetical protein